MVHGVRSYVVAGGGRGMGRAGAGRLLGDDASFVNGAVVPADGGPAAAGLDPEER